MYFKETLKVTKNNKVESSKTQPLVVDKIWTKNYILSLIEWKSQQIVTPTKKKIPTHCLIYMTKLKNLMGAFSSSI